MIEEAAALLSQSILAAHRKAHITAISEWLRQEQRITIAASDSRDCRWERFPTVGTAQEETPAKTAPRSRVKVRFPLFDFLEDQVFKVDGNHAAFAQASDCNLCVCLLEPYQGFSTMTWSPA